MTISSWNVNGLRAIAKKTLIPWMQSFQPDILCLQETKVQEGQLTLDLMEIEGYKPFFSCAEKKGYSGTAVYIKIKPDQIKTDGFPDHLSGEGRIIEIHLDSIVLFNVYFPNGQMSEERLQYKLRFYDEFFQYYHSFQQKNIPVIIAGDFNTAHHPIDLAEPDKNRKTSGFLESERKKIDFYLQHDLVDIFRLHYPDRRAYTYWSYFANARIRNLGWRIDYFLVSQTLVTKVSDIHIHQEIMGSDHCPLSITLLVR